MAVRSTACTALVGVCVACGGQVTPDSADRDTGAAFASNAAVSVPNAGPPPASEYTAAQVQAAQALCNAPHGLVVPATTPAQVAALVVGAWFFCGWEGAPYAGQTTSSQEFLPGGQWYALAPATNGGLVQGQGLDSQGTWDFDSSSGDTGCPRQGFDGVVWVNTNAGGDDDTVGFETGPRRLRAIDTSGIGRWYVALGE